jgi:chromosome segregation ATPase
MSHPEQKGRLDAAVTAGKARREKQIAEALEVLAPAPKDRDRARHDIEEALDRIAEARINLVSAQWPPPMSHAAYEAIKSLRSALKRASRASHEVLTEHGPMSGLSWAWADDLRPLIAQCEKELQQVNKRGKGRQARDADTQRNAVREARQLIELFGESVGARRATSGISYPVFWPGLRALFIR